MNLVQLIIIWMGYLGDGRSAYSLVPEDDGLIPRHTDKHIVVGWVETEVINHFCVALESSSWLQSGHLIRFGVLQIVIQTLENSILLIVGLVRRIRFVLLRAEMVINVPDEHVLVCDVNRGLPPEATLGHEVEELQSSAKEAISL